MSDSKQSSPIDASSLINESLVEKLSEVGRFSLSALLATALYQLYNDNYNKEFASSFLYAFLAKMKESPKVITSCESIFRGETSSAMGSYTTELMKETTNVLLLKEILIFALQQHKGYDARIRTLLKHLAISLKYSWDDLEELEHTVVQMVKQKFVSDEDLEETAHREKSRSRKRYLLIGAVAVGGGALIGLTGGLAAPFIAAGAGAIIGGGTAAAIGTVTGAAILGSIFGVAGAGLTGYKMQRRIGKLDEFEFHPLQPPTHQLNVTIAISGFIQTGNEDFVTVWKTLKHSKEQYYLLWESKYLLEMGQAVDYFLGFAKKFALNETLKLTILSGLLAAVAWPGALLSASNVIDNPYSVCSNRAEEAGKILASVLIAREQGNRPVTLIGYSMGARVIYYCLLEMGQRKRDVLGIIEDVYIMGTPAPGSLKDWAECEKIVSGRIVNVYSKQDWLLRFLFRTATASVNIAGLQPIEGSRTKSRKIVNVDASSIINGHGDYYNNMPNILKLIGLRTEAVSPSDGKSLWSLPAEKPTTSASVPNIANSSEASELSSSSTISTNTVHSSSHNEFISKEI